MPQMEMQHIAELQPRTTAILHVAIDGSASSSSAQVNALYRLTECFYCWSVYKKRRIKRSAHLDAEPLQDNALGRDIERSVAKSSLADVQFHCSIY